MKWIYTPRRFPIFGITCPTVLLNRPLAYGDRRVQYPFSPPCLERVQCIPLPSDSHQLPSSAPTLFPLIITLPLQPETASRLSSVAISANSIHIHDTTSHIGDISTPGGAYSALDIVNFVSHLARQNLSLSTFHQLSNPVKERVEHCFKTRYFRGERGVSANGVWATFLDGQQTITGPKGVDLLLGNICIWGLEFCPISGHWILHVADPSVAYSEPS